MVHPEIFFRESKYLESEYFDRMDPVFFACIEKVGAMLIFEFRYGRFAVVNSVTLHI